jgi:hypothetical protein
VTARRILVLLAALLVFVGSAPTATASALAVGSHGSRADSGRSPQPKSPTVTEFVVARRTMAHAIGAGRRFGHGRTQLRAFGALSAAIARWSNATRVGERRETRSFHAANAPHCGRGPPSAS